MQPGLPLNEPADLNTATPPFLNLRLVAARTMFDISGKKVWGDSYNGAYVGPTMHLVPGERVNLTLVNELSTPTDLHFHGLHLSPSGAADDPFISVASKQSFTYRFTVPWNQPLGTFWYHDHDMCMGNETMAMPGMNMRATPATNCLDIESQIYDGLSGTIIVGDARSLLPPALRNIPARTLVFKDMQITAKNHIVENSSTYSIDSGADTVRLVNGQLDPVLTMRPGSTELWRLANEGADIFYNLNLNAGSFTVVGQDGYPATQATSATSLLLPPGKRFDVLVTAPKTPATETLQTLAYSNGPQGDTYPRTKLMQIRIAGQTVSSASVPPGSPLTTQPSLASAQIAQDRSVTLSEDSAGLQMFINGQQFDPNTSIFSTPAVLDTTEQWTIYNDSGEIHPFHLHAEHFQVMSVNGVPQPFLGQQDTVLIPFAQNGVPGQVVIRTHFADYTGKVMFHCHIAAHEDAGMMSYINVVAPPSDHNHRHVRS